MLTKDERALWNMRSSVCQHSPCTTPPDKLKMAKAQVMKTPGSHRSCWALLKSQAEAVWELLFPPSAALCPFQPKLFDTHLFIKEELVHLPCLLSLTGLVQWQALLNTAPRAYGATLHEWMLSLLEPGGNRITLMSRRLPGFHRNASKLSVLPQTCLGITHACLQAGRAALGPPSCELKDYESEASFTKINCGPVGIGWGSLG